MGSRLLCQLVRPEALRVPQMQAEAMSDDTPVRPSRGDRVAATFHGAYGKVRVIGEYRGTFATPRFGSLVSLLLNDGSRVTSPADRTTVVTVATARGVSP